jgi:hypothetical protein
MPGKKAKTLIFLTAMAAILAAFILLSVYDQPPRLPSDADHSRNALEHACLKCHDPSGPNPYGRHHTNRRQCYKCHKP